jgi:DNA primase
VPNLEEIIERDYTLKGHGRYLKTIEHDSLVVDTEKQIFFWNSKGINGNAFDWLTKIKGMSIIDARKYLGEFNPILYTAQPEKSEGKSVVNEGLVDIFFELGKYNRDYWRNRGYYDTTIDMFKLGYTGEWYVIPFFVHGIFRNFQCRKPDRTMKGWYRGVGPLPFNLDYVKNQKLCILTEGPVDAIMCMQNGLPAMSTNAGADYFDTTWIMELADVKEIYIAYDNDPGGRFGARRVGKMFGTKAKIYTFNDYPEKYDPNDFFKDGGTNKEFLSNLREKGKYWFEIGKEK